MIKSLCKKCGKTVDFKQQYCETCRTDYHRDRDAHRHEARGLYRDPRWHKVRGKALKRDAHICQRCYIKYKFLEKRDLQVHHIEKITIRPDLAFNVDNLITLCRTCHTKIERIGLDFIPNSYKTE